MRQKISLEVCSLLCFRSSLCACASEKTFYFSFSHLAVDCCGVGVAGGILCCSVSASGLSRCSFWIVRGGVLSGILRLLQVCKPPYSGCRMYTNPHHRDCILFSFVYSWSLFWAGNTAVFTCALKTTWSIALPPMDSDFCSIGKIRKEENGVSCLPCRSAVPSSCLPTNVLRILAFSHDSLWKRSWQCWGFSLCLWLSGFLNPHGSPALSSVIC